VAFGSGVASSRKHSPNFQSAFLAKIVGLRGAQNASSILIKDEALSRGFVDRKP